MAQKKRNIKFGFLFWIAFILVVLLLFFINRNNIKHVLESVKSNAASKNKTETPQAQIQKEIERINEKSDSIETPQIVAVVEPDKKTETETKTSDKKVSSDKMVESKKESTKIKETTKTDKSKTDNKKDSQETESKKVSDKKKSSNVKDKETDKKSNTEEKLKTRTATVYFVVIDADGHISRVASKRNLAISDSPMSDALKSLFAGTTKTENKNLYRSLIPPETKLLGATVRNGVAYINVSESFEFNQYGIEGYLAELAQVVFTATEFPTVNSVQFLIEGRKKNYLGSDGVWIGSPLSRDAF